MEDGGGFRTGASFKKAPEGRRYRGCCEPMDYIYLGGGNSKIFLIFILLFGERIQFDYSNIFQIRWFNHQLLVVQHWAFIIPMVTSLSPNVGGVYPKEPEPERVEDLELHRGQFVKMSHFLQVQTCKRWFGPGGPTNFLNKTLVLVLLVFFAWIYLERTFFARLLGKKLVS